MRTIIRKFVLATIVCTLAHTQTHALNWPSPRAFITAVGNVAQRFIQPFNSLASKVSSFMSSSKEKLGFAYAAFTARFLSKKRISSGPAHDIESQVPQHEQQTQQQPSQVPVLVRQMSSQPHQQTEQHQASSQPPQQTEQLQASVTHNSTSSSTASSALRLPIIDFTHVLPITASQLGRSCRSKSEGSLVVPPKILEQELLKRSKTAPCRYNDDFNLDGGDLKRARDAANAQAQEKAKETKKRYTELLGE